MSAAQEAIAEHDEKILTLEERLTALEDAVKLGDAFRGDIIVQVERIRAHLDPPGTNRALTPRPAE